MMKSSLNYIAILLLLCVSTTAKTENQSAHVHGLAMMTLALENGELEIYFESPAANIIGFEHKAKSAEEKQFLKQAEKTLSNPKLLFSFVGNECKVKEVSVDVSAVEDVHSDHDEHDDHSEHGHSDHHAEHKHEEHHSEHDHEEHHDHKEHDHSEHHEDDGHSEMNASYHFTCKNDKKLTAIKLTLFKYFPNLEKVKTAWITESQQGSAQLTPNSNTLSLRKDK